MFGRRQRRPAQQRRVRKGEQADHAARMLVPILGMVDIDTQKREPRVERPLSKPGLELIVPKREDAIRVVDQSRITGHGNVYAAREIAVSSTDARIDLDVARKRPVTRDEEPQRTLVIELLRHQRSARGQATTVRRGDHRDGEVADLRPQTRHRAAHVGIVHTSFVGLCLVGHFPIP